MIQEKIIMAQRWKGWPRVHQTKVCVSDQLYQHLQSEDLVPPCASFPGPEAPQAAASTSGQGHVIVSV